MAFADIMIQ